MLYIICLYLHEGKPSGAAGRSGPGTGPAQVHDPKRASYQKKFLTYIKNYQKTPFVRTHEFAGGRTPS